MGLIGFFARKFGGTEGFGLIMSVIGHEVLNALAPLLAVAVWWRRNSTRQVIRDLVQTPCKPEQWLMSSLRPGQAFLTGIGLLFVAIQITYWIAGDIRERDVREIILATAPANLFQSYINIPMVAALLVLFEGRLLLLFWMAMLMLSLQTLLIILVLIVAGFRIIDNSAQYGAIVLVTALAQAFLWRYLKKRLPEAARRHMHTAAGVD